MASGSVGGNANYQDWLACQQRAIAAHNAMMSRMATPEQNDLWLLRQQTGLPACEARAFMRLPDWRDLVNVYPAVPVPREWSEYSALMSAEPMGNP